jgi:hypothetical protein
VELQEVGEARNRLAPSRALLVGGKVGTGRHRREVRLQLLVIAIDVTVGDVVHPECLHRGDDDGDARLQVLRADLTALRDVEHADGAAERVGKGRAIGMAGLLQRRQRLFGNGGRGCQPQHDRIGAVEIGVADDADGVSAEQGLTAAGRQAQAAIGGLRQARDRAIGGGVSTGLTDRHPVGVSLRMRLHRRSFEKGAERIQRARLIGLELHQRALTS